MHEYRVYFSFYSEEYGNFDDKHYTIEAENQFEAREKAWLLCDKDEEMRLCGCIKQYAVTWQPNYLDMEDYFNSHAADIKQTIREIENVKIPNDRIKGNERRQEIERSRHYYLGSLQAVDLVAKGLFADKGMIPPSVYEELHYADKLYEQLGYGEKADAIWERMERAKKWDYSAIYSMRDLFKNGYTTLCGETVFCGDEFGRNGIYPVHANLDDKEYGYINRWNKDYKIKVERLHRLPMLQENDVIPNSRGYMYFEGQILVLDKNHFKDEYQTPENILWRATHGNGCNPNAKGRSVWADNVITGEHLAFYRHDFLGVLRPDIESNIDFEAIKNEYVLLYGDKDSAEDISDEQSDYDRENDFEGIEM